MSRSNCVDPKPRRQKGSILAVPESLNTPDAGSSYIVEGIGYDFIPDVLAREAVDVWFKTSDEESFEAVKKLMRLEGLLVGGSSGSALSGALRWLHSNGGCEIAQAKGANVVVLLPDGYVLLSMPFDTPPIPFPPSHLAFETI